VDQLPNAATLEVAMSFEGLKVGDLARRTGLTVRALHHYDELGLLKDPLSPEVLALARRWQGLVNEFTGGDPGIERSVGRLWKEQGDSLVNRHGAEYDSRGLSEYIGQAIAAVKGGN
jgi:hypothetical protein